MNPKLYEMILTFFFGILLTIASGLMQAYSKRLRNSKIAASTHWIGLRVTFLTFMMAGMSAGYKITQNLLPVFSKIELPWAIGCGFLAGIVIFFGYFSFCAAFLPTLLIRKWVQRKSPEIEFPPPSNSKKTQTKVVEKLIKRIKEME